MEYGNLLAAREAYDDMKKNGITLTRRTKYHFEILEPGDSIFICEPDDCKKLRVLAYMYGKKHRKSFSVRRIEGGLLLARNPDSGPAKTTKKEKPSFPFHPLWPIHSMAIGGKPFFVPKNSHSTKRVRLSVHEWAKHNGMSFSVVPVAPDIAEICGEGTLIYRVR